MISEKLSTDSRRMLQNGVPQFVGVCRCTPRRQRRGKGLGGAALAPPPADAPRAGSAEAKLANREMSLTLLDAPRAGSAEAKPNSLLTNPYIGDAPRAGSAEAKHVYTAKYGGMLLMHPVQAAPRQSSLSWGSCRPSSDAPRAGSAKQNNNVPPDGPLTTGRHFFTFHPSRIPTALPSSSVTMYNPVPIFLTDPAWRSRIFPTVPMLSVTGLLRGYAWCGESPWG